MPETLELKTSDNFFGFGENWTKYVDNYLKEELIEEAAASIRNFCGEENIKDKVFLDIGCGSGLFSLIAYKLGAKKVISIDIDDNSTACCKRLKDISGNPENWIIEQGSILDDDFLAKLKAEDPDFIYSWGVLHHTGNMWAAIDNTMSIAKPGAHVCIAIYNKTEGIFHPCYRPGNSAFWHWEKKVYCSLPKFVQSIINYSVMGVLVLLYLLTLQNPMKKIKEHKSFRGMSWSIDIIDWLGGYPYECASVAEIFNHVKKQGFSLENLISNNGLLNNEYLFKRQ